MALHLLGDSPLIPCTNKLHSILHFRIAFYEFIVTILGKHIAAKENIGINLGKC